jgi:hypothetical protein
MDSAIQRRWQAMENMNSQILQEIKNWGTQELQHQNSSNDWNALQVIQHIIISEKGTLGYLMKKTSSGVEGLDKVTAMGKAAGTELQKALKSSEKWKAPNVMPDPEPIDLEKSIAYWLSLRVKYEEFLGNLDPAFIPLEIFKHPLAGRIDLMDTLDFLSNHIQHHMYQLERIKRAQKLT